VASTVTSATVAVVVVVAVGRDHDECFAAVAQGRQTSGGVHLTTTAVAVVFTTFVIPGICYAIVMGSRLLIIIIF